MFVPICSLEFQRRVLYLLPDVKDILQKVCRKYEEPDSDFHIEKAETMDDLDRILANLKVVENKKLLVGIFFLYNMVCILV